MSGTRPDRSLLLRRLHDRFGLGARPADGLRSVDGLAEARDTVRAQLRAGPEPATTAYPGGDELPTAAEILDLQREGRAARGPERGEPDRDALRSQQWQSRRLLQREMLELLGHRLRTERPFMERWVAFWSNHLCVSATDPTVVPWAGHYERHAVRPHVLGRYADLLLASARHPAMLLYLDNATSIGPDSAAARFARRRGNERGLNENYARELLELHTVGVDGGYDQRDVEQLALALTGWTLEDAGRRLERRAETLASRAARRPGDRRGPGPEADLGSIEYDGQGFAFVEDLHQPGAKTLLGHRLREDGSDQGVAAIELLAGHERTARFVATKLARHFVADDPPAAAVEAVAGVFESTGGDLRRVALAVVELDEPWASETRKFRSPQDWLLAGLRAGGADRFPLFGLEALRRLRQPLWGPSAPTGYGDRARDWADPAGLKARAELARSLASSPAGRAASAQQVLGLVDDCCEQGSSEPALRSLRSLVRDESLSESERLALVLASPFFQWR